MKVQLKATHNGLEAQHLVSKLVAKHEESIEVLE